MSTEKFRETQRRVGENDPPVEVNQLWSAPDNDGKVFRRVRILAPYPDLDKNGGRLWIYKDEEPFMNQKMPDRMRMVTCPEFNLRYVFTLEGVYEKRR